MVNEWSPFSKIVYHEVTSLKNIIYFSPLHRPDEPPVEVNLKPIFFKLIRLEYYYRKLSQEK